MRHLAIGAVGLAMLAIAFSVRSDLRMIDLGRKQVPGRHRIVRQKIEVIPEAPPTDFPAPSLGVNTAQPLPPQETQPVAGGNPIAGQDQIVIQRGVQPSAPLLSGGIFRR